MFRSDLKTVKDFCRLAMPQVCACARVRVCVCACACVCARVRVRALEHL